MSRYGFAPYESVEVKKAKALKTIEKLRKKDPDISPVIIEGRVIAKSWWGKGWNVNLESYADYSNRIGRGKSYVKQHAVVDLRITKGLIKSKVQGSRAKPYEINILIEPLSHEKWQKITDLCRHRIESLEQLLQGKFPEVLEVLFTDKSYGLFPAPKEIKFDCSCPDWAIMCKHIAATLYAISARLDDDPMLFFELRDIDVNALIQKTVEEKLDSMLKNARKKSERAIGEDRVGELFGLTHNMV